MPDVLLAPSAVSGGARRTAIRVPGIRRRPSLWTLAAPLVLATPLLTAPAAPAAATPVGAPPCESVRGAELGRTDTWRIVRTGSPFEVSTDAQLVACRLGVKGPAQVRVLGTSKVIDDAGEDNEPPSGGPYVTLLQFEGGRAVLLTRTFTDPMSYDTTGSVSYVDLDRGARTTLLDDYRYSAIESSDRVRYHGLATVMTASGGLAFAPTTEEPPAGRTTGPWTIWDAQGQRTAPGLRDVALSRGSSGRPAGLYFRDDVGHPARLPLDRAAATDALPIDPALALQTIPLETIPPQRGGFTNEFLVPPSTIALETTFGSVPQLEFSTSSDDPAAVVRILDEDQERRLGTLAPGAYPHLKVIAGSYGVAFLLGRFAGHPHQRRVRLATTSRKATTFFDVPARRSMVAPAWRCRPTTSRPSPTATACASGPTRAAACIASRGSTTLRCRPVTPPGSTPPIAPGTWSSACGRSAGSDVGTWSP